MRGHCVDELITEVGQAPCRWWLFELSPIALVALGLDELSFRGSANNADGTTTAGAITLGKRFSQNFYAAYERSISGALGTLFVFYDLSQRFTVRAQTGEQSAVDLIYTFSYN